MLLPIHIAAGALAIILGAVALSVKKGGTTHRRSGLLFVYAMLIMAVSASMLSLLKGRGEGNVLAGVLTAYFVGTALTTVRPVSSWTRRINAVALTVAVVLAAGCAFTGARMVNTPGHDLNGVPNQTAGMMSLIIGVLLVMAAAGDVRIMRFGMPRGGPRLARHLWRMCFALFIAAGSFFSLRERVAHVLPQPFTSGPMRALPIVLLFGAMFYWLWRVRGRGTLPMLLRHDPVAVARRAN
jgi:uncharacterized membrane protein